MRRIFGVLLLVSALVGAFFLLQDVFKPPSGTLNVQVVDGRTEQPLAGAVVVLPETDAKGVTGADGYTGPINVPYMPHAQSGMEEAPWCEVTVLVYCQGYYSYALFHVSLQKGEAREGPRVYLFPNDGSMGDTPFVIVEAPPTDWSRTLLDQYRPED